MCTKSTRCSLARFSRFSRFHTLPGCLCFRFFRGFRPAFLERVFALVAFFAFCAAPRLNRDTWNVSTGPRTGCRPTASPSPPSAPLLLLIPPRQNDPVLQCWGGVWRGFRRRELRRLSKGTQKASLPKFRIAHIRGTLLNNLR